MVPAMLFMNVQARVASSTSAFNYFWLSLNNLFALIFNNDLPTETMVWFIILAVFV
jgi:uncharacterized membrane protein YfcA